MAEALIIRRPLEGLHRTATFWRQRAGTLISAYPREAIGLGTLGFVSAVALGSLAIPNPATSPAAHAAPPAPPPLILQPIAPDKALQANASIPLTDGPNPAA